MPAKASTADIRKSNHIKRIEAFGVSFTRAFPRWKQPPADLGVNTLSAIEAVIKELQKRSLTTSAIEQSLRKAAQVWEGRGNRRANRPSAAQFHRLLDFLRTPSAVSDPDRPVLAPRTDVQSGTRKKNNRKTKQSKRVGEEGNEEGGDQENADEEDSEEEEEDSGEEDSEEEDTEEEEDSEEERDSEDEEDQEEGESENQEKLNKEDSEDKESSETGGESGKEGEEEEEEEEEDREDQDRNEPDTFNHQSQIQADNDDTLNLYNDDEEDQPLPNHDDINEQRLGLLRDNSRAKAVHRRRQRVLVVVPPPPPSEEEENERSIERGRGAQLHLSPSHDFTSASNSLLTLSSHPTETPPQHQHQHQHQPDLPADSSPPFQIPFPLPLESSGSSPLTALMARQRSTTPSQRATNFRSQKNSHASNHASNHAKASRPSLQQNQLISDQDAAKQAVTRAQNAYIETEKRLESIIRSCTYEPPTYDITCKEGTLPTVHSRQQQQQPQWSRKRKAQDDGEQDKDEEGEEDPDDRAVLAIRLEQERHDQEWIASETRALEDFKRRRITSVSEVMGKRRIILEKRAWAQKAVEAAQDRIKLESRFEALRGRYEGIEADLQQEQPEEGLEENGNDENDDTHEENTEGGIGRDVKGMEGLKGEEGSP